MHTSLSARSVQFPAAFTVSAPDKLTDYSAHARDLAVEVKVAYRFNTVLNVNGRELLTGWHEAAAVKLTIFVSSPISEDAAIETAGATIGELMKTLKLMSEVPDYCISLMVNVPLGCRIVRGPKIVARKRPRNAAYLGDYLASVRDAWRANLAHVEAVLAEPETLAA